MQFDYDAAFDRNIGWITADEQRALQSKRIAIAGLGGVGGIHLLTLCRMGVGRFHLAEFDKFDLVNFNRQVGATMSTLHRLKLDVMCESARDINPDLQIGLFAEGVNASNIDDFLDGVDLYVDGLDFFAFDARQLVFAECAKRGIPAVTAAPLGMSTALMNFLPGEMTFDEYFQFGDANDTEKALRFFIGLAPRQLQMAYLVDPSRIDLEARKGPSNIVACMLSAGVVGAEATKLLLGRGEVLAAPWSLQFDAFLNEYTKLHRPGGNAHPDQRRTIDEVRAALGLG